MGPMTKDQGDSWFSPVFAGLIYAMLVAGTSTIILSLLLAATGLKEQSMPTYVYLIHGLAVFVGGFIAARRSGEKGLYRGGLLGIIYCLIVVLISYLGFDVRMSLQTLIFVCICFLTGALGGILGINVRK